MDGGRCLIKKMLGGNYIPLVNLSNWAQNIYPDTYKTMKDSDCGDLNTTCKILVPSALRSTYQNATNGVVLNKVPY